MTSPRIFLEGRCFFLPKPLKPWEYEVPRSIYGVVMGNDHKVAACLYAQLWLLGDQSLGESPVPALSVRVERARTNTQGCVPFLLPSLPVSPGHIPVPATSLCGACFHP